VACPSREAEKGKQTRVTRVIREDQEEEGATQPEESSRSVTMMMRDSRRLRIERWMEGAADLMIHGRAVSQSVSLPACLPVCLSVCVMRRDHQVLRVSNKGEVSTIRVSIHV
jgi:hypothetical protein